MTRDEELRYAEDCLRGARAKMLARIDASGLPHKLGRENPERLGLESLDDLLADALCSVCRAQGYEPDESPLVAR